MMKTFLIIFLSLLLYLPSYPDNQYHNDSIRATQSYRNASILIRNGNYLEAIDTLKYSARLRENLYSKKSYSYGLVQNALGISYRNLGNLNKALESFLIAEKAYLNELEKNNLAIARLYNNIGNVYFNKLNYGTAAEYHQNAVDIFKSQQEIDEPGLADIYYSLANTYFELRKFDEALNIIEDYQQNAFPDTKLFFLSLKAVIYHELNQINKANNSYQDAIRYAKSFYSESDINLGFEYINYADFLIKNNKIKEAQNVLNHANEIFVTNGINNGILYSLYLKTIGYLQVNRVVETKDWEAFRFQKIHNLTEAINSYKKSLESLGVNINKLSDDSGTLTSTVSLSQSLELLKLIADTYTQISDLFYIMKDEKGKKHIQNALDYYKIITRLIQKARKEIYSDENKIQLSELEEATFLKIIQTAWKANIIEPDAEVTNFAFATAERMKASSIFDRLSDQLARENSLIPDSLTDLELFLNYSITSTNEKLFNLRHEKNPDDYELLKTDSILFQLKKQRDELNQHLERNYIDYYDMKYSNSMISISDVQQNLKSNEVMIEYVLNENDTVPEIYAFIFTNNQIKFSKLNADSTFISSLEETFRFISNPAYLFTRNNTSKKFCLKAHYLYQILLQPFAELIQKKKIIIVPDGKLNYLPFEALLTEMPDTSGLVQFNSLPYLILNHTINYSYSANLLFRFENQNRQAKNRLLAFAPEYNSDTVHFDSESLVLIPLPGIQREVNLIANEVNARLFKGTEATEKNFREECKNHDILHLAMHAFINDSLPAYSRFAFTQNNDTVSDNDGWLNTADIYNLDLDARLTVLSACNTGRGNLRKGEGVMSLARGFLYAGCPSIVMSLWEVEDNAGTEIMHSFYKTLKKGRNTDDALRQAKLQYLENANPRLAHPHYWLGYVSIGNSDSLFRSYDLYFFGLLILALGGLTADQILHFRKSEKKRYKRK